MPGSHERSLNGAASRLVPLLAVQFARGLVALEFGVPLVGPAAPEPDSVLGGLGFLLGPHLPLAGLPQIDDLHHFFPAQRPA